MAPRRRWLERLAGSVLALCSVSAFASPRGTTPEAFRAPGDERILTRILRRPLGDGSEVVTTRRYAVRFVSDDDGYRVEGHEIDRDVVAPAVLAPLAAIERARRDEGMFPMLLDREGHIVGLSGNRIGPTPAMRDASRKAGALFASARLSDAERATAEDMSRRVLAHITAWPSDLFRPAGAGRREAHEMLLPDGSNGRVTVEITAEASGAVMYRFERAVTTEAGGRAQRSTETWLLERVAKGDAD